MKIKFSITAIRDIKKLDPNIQSRIKKKLEWFVVQENPLYFAEPITESEIGKFRFRIGSYRVLFDVSEDRQVILVHTIGNRKEVYK